MKIALLLSTLFFFINYSDAQQAAITKRNETTDRVAIRELIDNYGYYADKLEADNQAALFTETGLLEIYAAEPADTVKPILVLTGRHQLADNFKKLKQFKQTFHLMGQSTINLYGDSAVGRVYCVSHHILMEDNKQMVLEMGIHYYDTYTYQNNQWLIARRKLIIDWQDKHASKPDEP